MALEVLNRGQPVKLQKRHNGAISKGGLLWSPAEILVGRSGSGKVAGHRGSNLMRPVECAHDSDASA
jgi:hypothetical protein